MRKRKAQINPRIRRRLDLREHVIAVKRHNGFARASLDFITHRFAKL